MSGLVDLGAELTEQLFPTRQLAIGTAGRSGCWRAAPWLGFARCATASLPPVQVEACFEEKAKHAYLAAILQRDKPSVLIAVNDRIPKKSHAEVPPR
jgi:hypothetical protein